jgi:hypothetical protein
VSEVRSPWDHLPPPVVRERREEPVHDPDAPKTKLGRKRKATANYGQGPDDGWLFHHLIAVGPSEDISLFQEAARGPGIIPWRLDYAAIEEDIFNMTASQPPALRGVSVEYCRDQARQFVERVQAREARAAALAVGGRGCPFDLQALLPIPSDILELGMRHPTAVAWLAQHWGTKHRLLQVAASLEARPGRRIPADNRFLGYRFYTVDHAPAEAVQAIAQSRPRLSFTLRSRPARWEKGWLT